VDSGCLMNYIDQEKSDLRVEHCNQ